MLGVLVVTPQAQESVDVADEPVGMAPLRSRLGDLGLGSLVVIEPDDSAKPRQLRAGKRDRGFVQSIDQLAAEHIESELRRLR